MLFMTHILSLWNCVLLCNQQTLNICQLSLREPKATVIQMLSHRHTNSTALLKFMYCKVNILHLCKSCVLAIQTHTSQADYTNILSQLHNTDKHSTCYAGVANLGLPGEKQLLENNAVSSAIMGNNWQHKFTNIMNS